MVLSVGAAHFYGMAQQAAWNSVSGVGTFNYVPGHPSGLKQVKPLLFSKQTRGSVKRFGRYGYTGVDGTITGDFFYEGWDRLISTALARSTASGTNFKTHTYTIPDTTGAFDNVYGLTIYDHKDLKTFRNLSCFAKTLSWAFSEEPFIIFSAGIVGASRTRVSAVTPSFGSLAPATPFGNGSTTGLVIAVDVNSASYSAAYCKAANITITSPVDLAKSITSQAPIKVMRTGQYQVTGSWTWSYSSNDSLSEDWLAAWDAETTAAVTITVTGGTIASSSPSTPYSIAFTIPKAYITGEDPVVSGSGAIEQTFNFEAGLDAMTGTGLTLTLVNNFSMP